MRINIEGPREPDYEARKKKHGKSKNRYFAVVEFCIKFN